LQQSLERIDSCVALKAAQAPKLETELARF